MLHADGVRVVIDLNDHRPAHVFEDGEVKINLFGIDVAPELVWADNASRSEVRRAMRLVPANQTVLLHR